MSVDKISLRTKQDVEHIRSFFRELYSTLEANGVTVDSFVGTFLEVGYGENGEPNSMFLVRGDSRIKLEMGILPVFEELKKVKEINKRLEDLKKTLPPGVVAVAEEVINHLYRNINIDLSGEASVDLSGGMGEIYLKDLLKPGDLLERIGGGLPGTLKTLSQKNAEEVVLSRFDVKKIISDSVKNSSVFVGGIDLKRLSDIKSVDDAFAVILNVISFETLIREAIYCLNGIAYEIGRIRIPCFFFPDFLPTVDLMLSLRIAIEDGILNFIVETILAVLRRILEILLAYCQDVRDDLHNFNQTGDVAGLIDGLLESSGKTLDELSNFFGEFGLSPTAETTQALGGFLKDVSMAVSPSELLSLLNGRGSDSVDFAVGRLANFYSGKLPDDFIKDQVRIRGFFEFLGSILPKDKLDSFSRACAAQKIAMIGNGQVVCVTPSSPLADALRAKGIGDDVIQEQIERENEKRKNISKELSDILKNALNPPSIPEVCMAMKSAYANGFPRSVERQVNSTVGAVFDSVYAAFDRDAESWYKSVIIEKQKETAVQSPIGSDEFFNAGSMGDLGGLLGGNKIPPEILFGLLNGVKVEKNKFMSATTSSFEVMKEFTEKIIDSQHSVEKGFLNGEFYMSCDTPEDNFLADAAAGISTPISIPHEKLFVSIPTHNLFDGYLYYGSNLSADIRNVTPAPVEGEDGRRRQVAERRVLGSSAQAPVSVSRFSGRIKMPDHVSAFISQYMQSVFPSSQPQLKMLPLILSYAWSRKTNFVIDFSGFFTEESYVNFVSRIVRFISLRICKSASNVGKPAVLFSETGGSPILKAVKFTFKPKKCGERPEHLLNVDGVKDAVLDAFKNQGCVIQKSFSTENKPRERNLIENAMLSGVVLTTVRAYLLDYYLRGIFANYPFRRETTDGLLSGFVEDKFINNLTIFGEEYRNSFVESVNQVLSDILPAIEQQYLSVDGDVKRKVFGMSNQATLRKEFLWNAFPVVWVDGLYDTRRYSRFGRLTEEGEAELLNSLSGRRALFQVISPSPTDRVATVFNGGFILEKYVRLKKKVDADSLPLINKESWWTLDPDAFEGCQDPYSLAEFGAWVSSSPVGNQPIGKYWEKVSYGMRLSYVLPGPLQANQNIALFSNNSSNNPSVRFMNRERIGNVVDYNELKTFVVPVYEAEIENAQILQRTVRQASSERLFDFSDGIISQLAQQILDSAEFGTLFNFCYPLDFYWSFLTIYNILCTDNYNGGYSSLVFSSTREQLRFLFEMIKSGTDYISEEKAQDRALMAIGGSKALGGVLRTPLEETKGQDIMRMFNTPGFDLGTVLKFLLDTPKQVFRGLVEFADPNIMIASKAALFSRLLTGQDIPVGVFSMGLMPSTVMPGSWFGPPLTPLGMIYLILSMGFSLNIGNFQNEVAQKFREESESDGINMNGGIINPFKCEEEE